MKALLAALVLVVAAVAPAQADPVKCTRAINKEVSKYIKTVVKNVDKCKNKTITKGENSGLLSNCTVAAIKAGPDDKIEKAALKMKAGIAKKCGGDNKTCDVPPGDGDDDLAAINWAIGSCMNFETGTGTECDNAIDTCGDIGDCLECMVDKAMEQAIDGLIYDQFNAASFFPSNGADPEKRYNKCQVTIAKNVGKFITGKQKTLSKCWDSKLNGKDGFVDGDPCPDTDPKLGGTGDNKTVEKIKKIEQKKVGAICKACGGTGDSDKDGLCDLVDGDLGGGVTATLGDIISLPYVCPSVSVPPNAVHPAGLDCANPDVDTLQEYIDCIDCVLEFKVDCLSSAAVGDGNPGAGIVYPGQCNPGICGNDVTEVGETCDGTDDIACPSACSSLCTCPGTTVFTLDETAGASEALLEPLALAVPLTGDVTLDIGEEVVPGAFPFLIPEGQLPGADISVFATICPFLVNDPNEFPAGFAGEGVINCAGADLSSTSFPVSPEISSFSDHCVQGAGCDSAPNGGGGLFSTCVGGVDDGMPCAAGGICTAPGTCTGGVFVPDQPIDAGCSPPNSADGLVPHAGACNSPLIGPLVGAAPYLPGDATLTLNVALDIRGAGDLCLPPLTPGTATVLVTFTTGAAETGIMDTEATAGAVLSTSAAGTPFSCPDVLNGTATGASVVGAFSAIDSDLSIVTLDTATSIRFTAE